MNRSEQTRAFWDRRIARWDASSYAGEGAGGVMDRLRVSIDARMRTALEVLRPHAAGKSILDVGCGAGRLAIESVASLGAARAHGVDLSPVAIEQAKALADSADVADRVTFGVGTAESRTLPEADIVVGLGLLDWLDDAETAALLDSIRGRRCVLSFSEQDGSFAEIVHRFYLIYRLRLLGGKVRARHHRREEILGLLQARDLVPCEIVANREMRFGRLVHNLSDLKRPANA